jgi:UDPglucose--hexose-1-phosphate uridylyltransferase
MPELRQDPITLGWVTIATERARRPTSFTRAAKVPVTASARCPFCEGNEGMTLPERLAFRATGSAPNSPGWSFRVVPNLYPALGPADVPPEIKRDGLYTTMSGVGVHEVLIDSPDHVRDLADHGVEKVDQIVRGVVERFWAAAATPSVRYVFLLVNHGREAGASLEHPHSQLFGMPLVPERIERELAGVLRLRGESSGACPYCEMIEHEASGARVIYQNDSFLVFEPFASRVPFESWIIPKVHRPRFEAMDATERRAFADALHSLAARLKVGLNDPPYNLYVHTTPVLETGDEYHWHLELLPKLATAGFELGTGIYINVVAPEAAAELLRGVELAKPAMDDGPSSALHE